MSTKIDQVISQLRSRDGWWNGDPHARLVLKYFAYELTREIQEELGAKNQALEDVCCGATLTCPKCEKSLPCLCEYEREPNAAEKNFEVSR